jgi:hypothetical protein
MVKVLEVQVAENEKGHCPMFYSWGAKGHANGHKNAPKTLSLPLQCPDPKQGGGA